jgi:hypothetical protein
MCLLASTALECYRASTTRRRTYVARREACREVAREARALIRRRFFIMVSAPRDAHMSTNHSTARSRVAQAHPVPAEVHEFVMFKFKTSVSHEEQVESMRQLDTFLRPLAGFRSRDYYYSTSDERWVDHLVWADLASALASRRVTKNPDAAALYARFNQSSIAFSRYQRVPAE